MEELVIIFQLLDSDADIPYPVTILNRINIIEWHVVWYGSKNGLKKGMHHVFRRDWTACSEYAIILGSTVNTIPGGTHLYDHLMNMTIFTLKMNEIFI
jgi:hypothetical protein